MEDSHQLEKELNELKNLQMVGCNKNAVFTENQTNEIIRLDTFFNDLLLKKIKDLYSKISHVGKNDLEIERLISYDENNTEIISEMKREIDHSECELHRLEEKVDKLEEKSALALISQAHEIETLIKDNEINCIQNTKIKYLQENIEDMKKGLCMLEKREMKDERVESIIHFLDKVASKDEIKQIICDLTTLKHREMKDERVDNFICEISKLEKKIEELVKSNALQNNSIKGLIEQNNRQNEEIRCLSEKLNRNTLALDSKINEVEKQELVNEKIDLSQNANLTFIQSQISKLTAEVDRLQKIILVKPCE